MIEKQLVAAEVMSAVGCPFVYNEQVLWLSRWDGQTQVYLQTPEGEELPMPIDRNHAVQLFPKGSTMSIRFLLNGTLFRFEDKVRKVLGRSQNGEYFFFCEGDGTTSLRTLPPHTMVVLVYACLLRRANVGCTNELSQPAPHQAGFSLSEISHCKGM